MSKGSARRQEDQRAIDARWPLKRKRSLRTPVSTAQETAPKCLFCYKPMHECKHCGRVHCPCQPIANCQKPLRKRKHKDPLETTPYGFEVLQRTGFADGPPELDKEPQINRAFMEQRGLL